MKKFLSFVMCIVLVAVATYIGQSVIKVNATEIDGYTFTVTNNEATITEVDNSISGDITIPSTLDGYPVTSIGDYAFYNCEILTSISIPDGVTSIGEGAFYACYSLTFVDIGDGLLEIGESAFEHCTSLENISMGSNIEIIGRSAFYCCEKLNSITIPNSVKIIDAAAFARCFSISSIVIPDSVTSIGESLFFYCKSLENIVVSENNENYSSIDGILFNKDKTKIICYPAGKNSELYNIPTSVKIIDKGAFEFSQTLKSIIIPDTVTSIDDSAFYYCKSLEKVEIPISVTNMGKLVFSYCSSLTNINIPEGITNIGDRAFGDCTSLTNINIPEGITNIGQCAFEGCTSLTNILIPISVKYIDYGAFADCASLKNIYFKGRETQKNDIIIGVNNINLENAIWHYEACIDAATHTYKDDCDAECDICGETRGIQHNYGNDSICDRCGYKSYITGDIDGNGEVDASDLALLKLYLAGAITLE